MKKLIIILLLSILYSCNITTSKQDTQMLQSKYKIVYKINPFNYIVADTNYYHVIVTYEGDIESIIKIN